MRSRDQNYNLGWTHVVSPREPRSTRTPSAGCPPSSSLPSAGDTPVTAISDRSLDNYGLNAAVTWVPNPHHEVKVGGIVKRFPIDETFSFGITDPGFNDPESDGYNPDLAPYDLTRGGEPLFASTAQRTGTYARRLRPGQRALTAGSPPTSACATTTTTCRRPRDQLQPRARPRLLRRRERDACCGRRTTASSSPPSTRTSSSARRSWPPPSCRRRSRTRASWAEGCCSTARSARTPTRSGVQQALGPKLRLDVDFWWRRATYPADQDQFQNTGIVFPITFSEGRHNGWDVRLDLAETHGLRGFVSLGHTHAVYVPPPVGGLFLDVEAIDAITGGPFLIDHDQKLQAQGQLFWDIGESGAWLGANVRYDSGLVTDAQPRRPRGRPRRLLRRALRRGPHRAATSIRTGSRRGRSRASPSASTSRSTTCRSRSRPTC